MKQPTLFDLKPTPTLTCYFGSAWEIDCTSRKPCAKCEAFLGD